MWEHVNAGEVFDIEVLWVVKPRGAEWISTRQREILSIYSHRGDGGIMSLRNVVPPPFKHELFNL